MPRLFFEEIRAGGTRIDGATSIDLSPGNATFEVRLAAPTFAKPDEVMLETRLQGLEAQWQPRGSARDITYAGLPPGHYTFAARLVDRNTGTTSAPVQIAVVAVPWWWQRLSFKIALVMGLALMIANAFVLRGRRLRAQFSAIAEERARIARDLHDGLAQGFTSITLFVDSAMLELQKAVENTGKAADRPLQILGATKGIIDQCHREVRQAVFNLRAQQFGRVSVTEAIAQVVQATRKTSGADISFTVIGKPPQGVADVQLEQELPMLVQEALSNALAHGRATRINVRLETKHNLTTLQIDDNGCGISDEALSAAEHGHGGFGLVGMAERAARVRGKLLVQKASGGGTTVSLTMERTN